MKKILVTRLLLLFPFVIFSQTNFKGMIMDQNNPKENLGVEGASIHWLNTNVSAITNKKGWFTIDYKSTYKKLDF